MKKLIKIAGVSYVVEILRDGKFIVSKEGEVRLTFDEVILVVEECKNGKGETID